MQFMEEQNSLPFSQHPATCHCLKPDKSNPNHPILFLQDLFKITLLPMTKFAGGPFYSNFPVHPWNMLSPPHSP
jgi:hypothetical protein